MKRKEWLNRTLTTAGLATAAGLVLWSSTAQGSSRFFSTSGLSGMAHNNYAASSSSPDDGQAEGDDDHDDDGHAESDDDHDDDGHAESDDDSDDDGHAEEDDGHEGDGHAENNDDSEFPETITLTGIVRDFRELSEPGGHPDFERRPARGFGHYMGNIAAQLDNNGKPVAVCTGKKVRSQWRDSQGRPINPSLYNAALGDSAGSWGPSDTGGITCDLYYQWYRDIPGVNMSAPLNITLQRVPDSNIYIFDDKDDDGYVATGGFFPINGQLFGNSAGENKNFHFTFELSTEFTYQNIPGQAFTFTGDDDVWVFIDGRLVIDLGGVHGATSQTIDLSRLDWLQDGQTYSLKFFFAERHRTQSNFRIETTLTLHNAQLPRVMAMYD